MRRLFNFLLCIIIAFLPSSCSNPKERTFHIIETYRITSSSDVSSYLSVDLPISYGYQNIGELSVKNAENYFFEDRDDFRTLHASIEGNGEEKTITIEYEVALQNGKCKWEDGTSDQNLVPEEFIDSDNDNIVDIANTLKVDGDTYQTAKNISRYVSKTIKFDYSTQINVTTPLASEVLENKKGVCQDYANLMTAPIKFIAWSEDENTIVIPEVSITKK